MSILLGPCRFVSIPCLSQHQDAKSTPEDSPPAHGWGHCLDHLLSAWPTSCRVGLFPAEGFCVVVDSPQLQQASAEWGLTLISSVLLTTYGSSGSNPRTQISSALSFRLPSSMLPDRFGGATIVPKPSDDSVLEMLLDCKYAKAPAETA